ncbi:MAG TPA: adenylate/guanylate cyclase domain-containing protein [Gaiellaceae bacterium]
MRAPLGEPVVSQEQRKTVTVLFCDVVGSTSLGESVDPEALRALLQRYFDRMKGIVDRHGGTVEKFIGDAVMAVFGVPIAHEDDAVRAVRAAAEMRDALPELGVQARIGVNTGEVVTGTEERLATGDAVNIAARLQQAAGAGEILLGEQTHALARDAVTVEELPPLELKGKGRPVAAFRLTAVEHDAPGFSRHLDAPMIGRADEHKLLDDAFATAVRQGVCALFTLLGTAGVGKSRLVGEFLSGVDARVVVGRCLSYGEGITYWPVVEIVKQLGGVNEGLLAESPGAAETLAALLGELTTPTTPEQTAWAVRKLLEGAARDRPLVVVFDDVQWGEPTFLDLIEHVADLSRDAPILLLCVARPDLLDRRPGWSGGKLNATTVLLEPLDPAETDELIERLLGGELLADGMSERIRIAAEGNPLYVEEMLAMVRESGESEVTVPPTIKALLAARLDQLEPAERSVLARGAVEGQLFHSAAVAALASPPASADRQLVALVRKELVRPDRPQFATGDAYRFRHLLIRDAAYDALPKAVRAELHEKFAGWLEQRAVDIVESEEIVGYHLEQAYRYRADLGNADPALASRAAELLAASGRAARLRGDRPGAAGLLRRAADLAGPSREALLPELAEMVFDGGELTEAAELLAEASEAAHRSGDEPLEALAKVMRADVLQHAGDRAFPMESVIALADEAVAVLERVGAAPELARVLVIAGRQRFFTGRAREAAEVLVRARDIALGVGDLHRVRECVYWLHAARAFGPFPADIAREELALEAETLGSDFYWLAVDAGLLDSYCGRIDEARARFAEAKARSEELGLWLQRGTLMLASGSAELVADDTNAAERDLRDGYERLGELGEAGFRSTVATLLAEALVRQGRDAEAEEVLDAADALVAPDDVDPQVRLRYVRALVRARQGDTVNAVRLGREAVDLAAQTDYLVLHGDACFALGQVFQEAGSTDEAIAALRDALELFERKRNIPQAERTRALLRDLGQPSPPQVQLKG